MVKELSFNTISTVIDSWERLRRIDDYEVVAGTLLFKYLFEKCPKTKVLFGFPIDATTGELKSSKRFLMHGSYIIEMLDTALNLLGPDSDMLTEIMLELGIKHFRYGVTPEMYPHMGESLIHVLSELLGDAFTPACKEAWCDTYGCLTHDMIRAHQQHMLLKQGSSGKRVKVETV